jgi:dipeptidyl aminopeptidase/acylaminoacyl peptidase
MGFFNPARVGIYGGSFGGYAVLAALAFTPYEFACGVDIVGPSNLFTLLQTLPPYWAPLKALFDKRVGRVEVDQDLLRRQSPLFVASSIQAPLLVAHGANDPRVKRQESDQLVSAVRATSGRIVEYLVFKDEGHLIVENSNRLKFYAAAEQFLARHLGGRAELPMENETWHNLCQ